MFINTSKSVCWEDMEDIAPMPVSPAHPWGYGILMLYRLDERARWQVRRRDSYTSKEIAPLPLSPHTPHMGGGGGGGGGAEDVKPAQQWINSSFPVRGGGYACVRFIFLGAAAQRARIGPVVRYMPRSGGGGGGGGGGGASTCRPWRRRPR